MSRNGMSILTPYCMLWFDVSEQTHMSEMFAFHATLMSNTLGTSILVFTRTGFMALLLSHYRPVGTIFAFTNEYVSFSLRMMCSFSFHLKLYRPCPNNVTESSTQAFMLLLLGPILC